MDPVDGCEPVLTSSAVVVLSDRAHVDEILETIRGSGYEVEVVDTEEIRSQRPPSTICVGGRRMARILYHRRNELQLLRWQGQRYAEST